MNWKQAFAVGLIAPGMWDGKGEPVAYLFNGVRLSPLPEWDKKAYPCCHLIVVGIGVSFVAYKSKGYVIDDSTFRYQVKGESFLYFPYKLGGGWGDVEVITPTSDGGMPASALHWANYDVFREDGTLYLAATDPIPVYE